MVNFNFNYAAAFTMQHDRVEPLQDRGCDGVRRSKRGGRHDRNSWCMAQYYCVSQYRKCPGIQRRSFSAKFSTRRRLPSRLWRSLLASPGAGA